MNIVSPAEDGGQMGGTGGYAGRQPSEGPRWYGEHGGARWTFKYFWNIFSIQYHRFQNYYLAIDAVRTF